MKPITTEQKIKNAITWITRLKNTRMKQVKGRLGNKQTGFCCLGLGCSIQRIDYDEEDGYSELFQESVGLLNQEGIFTNLTIRNTASYANSLIDLNDDLNYSFRRISTVIKNNPHELFEPKVAKGIEQHFKK